MIPASPESEEDENGNGDTSTDIENDANSLSF